jgi:KUP system potassium uptake protein
VPILTLGVLGAARFSATPFSPPISVLSAVEGLEIGTHIFKPYIIPITVGVLAALFSFQRQGTAFVGALFGPVCMVWFLALAAAGIYNIAGNATVLQATNPVHALHFVTAHGISSFLVLGSIFLAVTGAEALYADMGHFGKRPIRIAWFALVLPSLVLNYFGQGALLIADPGAIVNPFYHAYPDWALYPMIGLATLATVIASQATISGAYSLCRQAIQLGYLPRLDVTHTSASHIGQVYLPGLNRILFVAVIITVLTFESSSKLASAYGLAVAGTMLITTVLTFFVIRHNWGYNLLIAAVTTGLFVWVDAFVLFGDPVQDPGRRLVSAAGGCSDVHPDGHLVAGPRLAEPAAQATVGGAGYFSGTPVSRPAGACSRHGGVSYLRAGHRAACTAAQPDAQQGAARAGRLSYRGR